MAALYSTNEMVKAYVEEGLATRKGGPFTKPPSYKNLRNHTYLGELLHKGESFPCRHQSIITQAQWDAAQAVIDKDFKKRRCDTKGRRRAASSAKGMLGIHQLGDRNYRNPF